MTSTSNFLSHGNLIDTMEDDWMDTGNTTELIELSFVKESEIINFSLFRGVSEVRSYDETTIRPPTKSMRSMQYKQSEQTSYEVSEGNLT